MTANTDYRCKSMTAFSRAESGDEQASFVWELRSVNHRYLETQFKLPEKFRFLEMKLREQLRQRLARGKVDVHLQFAVKESEQALAVNQSRVADLLQAVEQVNKAAGLKSQPSSLPTALQILQWPGILEQSEIDLDALQANLIEAFNKAIDQLLQVRATEGCKLAALINDRLGEITALVDNVEKIIPDILQSQRARLSARLDELSLDIDPERLAQEAVMYAQKTDVAEEVDRLRAHIEEAAKALSANKPCGRRLDFLVQEMNREANTLASKSVHVDTSQGAVDMKVLIEQIREQVQNIE